MKILRSWLQRNIEESLPSDEAIESALIFKSSEVEGTESIKLDDKDDTVFDIKVLPDRAHYMLSHRGVAYDLCAVLGLKLKQEKKSNISIGNDVKVKVESELCNRYSAVLIRNIDNSSSPQWIRSSLEAIGARSISGIVDATNYAMFQTGQPLHAFDADKIVGGITVRLAKQEEYIETLDGKNIQLNSHHLVIADDKGPLALAGIKGGKRAEVDINTKNIILESANFNPVSVRKTSFEVGIRNDSSKRFENEITPYLTEKGILCFLDLIKEISPECIIGNMTDIYTELPIYRIISIRHDFIESILNYKISSDRVSEILVSLNCKVKVVKDVYEVIPPFERLDMVIAEDIVDEIGRIQGLDKVKSVLPKANRSHPSAKDYVLAERIKDFFYKRGFSEVQSRTFTNKGDIEVAYPMALDKGFLRSSLINNISESMKLSEYNAPLLGLDKIQIFEIGKVFPKTGEQLDLCFAISYIKKIKNKEQTIKAELEGLKKELENELKVKLSIEIDKNIANIGDIANLDVKLDLSDIDVISSNKNEFVPFSNEPFIVRDIAVFVGLNNTVDEVRGVIKDALVNTANNLLVKGPDLFDEFQKEGKKSLAYRMIFQASDRTLTDEEINVIMEQLYGIIRAKGWEVR